MIIFRYLSKEICTALLAVTIILLLIFLSNQFVRYLSDAAAGKLAVIAILRLMTLEIPHLLGLLLPLGLFLGILLGLGRFYADNEMTVLAASGFSRVQLLVMILPVVLSVMMVVGILTLWVGPHILAYKNQVLAEMATGGNLQTMLPGRFQEIADGKRVFYVETISVDHKRMHNVFMAEQTNDSENPAANIAWTVLSADNGYQQIDPKTGESFIVTVDGHRYRGIPGQNDFEIIDYNKYWARTQTRMNDITPDENALSTPILWGLAGLSKHHAAELQWRLSMPLSALLLALLAIPLSQVKPRQGKYAKFLPAILIYIIYGNMLFVGRAWVSKGTLPVPIGMWAIHAGLLLLVLLIFLMDGTGRRWYEFIKLHYGKSL